MIIKDILGKELNCKCIGCSIGNGEIIPPGEIILSTENFILHQDPEIPIKAFLIIASKKHVKSLSQLTFEESQELFDLVYRARMALKSIKDIKEVSIIQEERSGHFHLWLLPRYEWMDEKFENSLSTVREILFYAKDNYKTEENIADILASVAVIRDYMKRHID
ncbi:HIT family hydrolase [Clostridium sp. C2-6-12]|uniref:HIT family protein n=1 Tax=Clostridium sp. C2-6-12 TaxID=2698832 RepID=UPI00136E6F8D|nr:HIT family hydrolase [Clostridium sp. C2-6-12]